MEPVHGGAVAPASAIPRNRMDANDAVPRTVLIFGFYAALATTVLTVASLGIAVMTPPLGGPGCTSGCFQYPFTDVASRFPRDYYWMYPAMLQLIAFAALAVALHGYAPREKKVFSHLGVGLAMISVATLMVDYFVQVSVIQPSLLNKEFDGIPLLTQFNPHGLFIALEEVGYILMSAALLCMAPVFSGATRVEKALRWIFASAFVLTVVAFVGFSLEYGVFREYRFEIAVITIDWLALIPGGALLAIVFRRELRNP